MRPRLRRFATIGLATAVLAASGCATRRPGPTPGIGGDAAPAMTTEERDRSKVAKTLLVVATVVVVVVALAMIAVLGETDGEVDY